MTQANLFDIDDRERVKSPICSYESHCGAYARLGEPKRVSATTVNRDIVCERCGAHGVESTRHDL
jgi:hypothetical protein